MMTPDGTPQGETPPTADTATRAGQRLKNMSLAAVMAPAGCLNVIIIVTALLLGLWLDAQFGVRGPFTIGLVLLSVPVSLFVMVRIALSAVGQITPPPRQKTDIGPDSANRRSDR